MIGYVYLRLVWTLVRSCWRPRLDPLAKVSTPLRVYPNDLDGNLHLNNGRYLTLMDIGRFDLTLRTGLMRAMLKNRWYPVLAGAVIRFRRPLNPFDRFMMTTQIVWWDERWLFLEQRFEKDGELCARAMVKAVFRRGKRSLPTAELLAGLGKADAAAPPKPTAIDSWQAADALLKE
jgi:acyl-CoA thioesterase FadM